MQSQMEPWALDFKFEIYQQKNHSTSIELYLPPLVFKLPAMEDARAVVAHLISRKDTPIHSLTVTSVVGSERWFQLDGVWRCKSSRRSI
jgi:hypothetical protein